MVLRVFLGFGGNLYLVVFRVYSDYVIIGFVIKFLVMVVMFVVLMFFIFVFGDCCVFICNGDVFIVCFDLGILLSDNGEKKIDVKCFDVFME